MMQAYIYRHVARIRYEPAGRSSFETDFSPYLLEPSAIGFTTYAIGHSSIVNQLRTFKLERIREAVLTRTEYRIPKDFPGLDILRSAWSIIYGEELTPVVLRFGPAVHRRVLETRWHPSEEKKDDPDKPGYLIWTAQIADTIDMLPWIRGWGADVEVVAPEKLREELMNEARRMARRYGVLEAKPMPNHWLLRAKWAKTNDKNPDQYHPLVCHSVDAGQVARLNVARSSHSNHASSSGVCILVA